jgi:hypothetical protein
MGLAARPMVLSLAMSRWLARTSMPGGGSVLAMRCTSRSTAVVAMATLSGEMVLIVGFE